MITLAPPFVPIPLRELAAEDRARNVQVGARWTARWFAVDDARKPESTGDDGAP